MSSVIRLVAYLAAAGFLVWRAQTFMDAYGGGGTDMLARIMCVVLALLLVLTGFVRALDDGSQSV